MLNRGKKLLALLLCVVLTAALVTVPAYAVDTHDHDHAAADIAAVSGVTAVAADCELSPDGKHHWAAKDGGVPGTTCPGITVTQMVCSYCGTAGSKTADEHHWGNWNVTAAANCTNPGSQTRECANCHQQETVTIPATNHTYQTVTQKATADTCTVTYQKCLVCGHIEGNTTAAHKWVKVEGDCTAIGVCSVCGTKDTSTTVHATHKFGSTYYHDENGHWQKCQNEGCEVTSTHEAHRTTGGTGDCTKGGTCSICGATGLSGQQHNFTNGKVTQSDAGGHYISCANPGCGVTQRFAHIPGTSTSCTDSVKCTVCGYTVSAGKGHTFGQMSQGDALGHTRTCSACGYVERASHVGENDDGDCTTPVKCGTCGYTLVQGYSSHAYSSTVWINDGTNGHYTLCSHPGCLSRQTGTHTGGTATCVSAAVCSVCGGSYGSANAANHDGGTEIRGAKPATVGSAGYTGDTYCLGCNQKIASGSTIPALTESHTHSYSSAWSSDSTSHWHACSCGDREDVAAHTFKDGECTVCGEADPNYKQAEEHIHTYSGVWSGDSREHWHECTVCGHQADRDTHRFLNGVCIECGMTFEQHQEEEKKEQEGENKPAVSETFSDISAGAWYVDAVQRMVDVGLMNGFPDGTFAPNANLDRAMLATILYRLDGEPGTGSGSFGDVKSGAYYADAVSWAAEKGIVEGYGDNSFRPDRDISRQELATILYRYARQAGHTVGGADDLSGFADQGQVASWAYEAMAWANRVGIVTGRGANSLAPTATATRAEVATMVVRFVDWVETGAAA